MSQAVLRRPSWKGSKESLASRHGPLLVDPMMYRSDSPGPPPSSFPQGHPAAGGSQRVNPPLPPQVRSVTPPPSRGGAAPPPSWDINPASNTKRYSGNLDYLVPRVSPVPQGPASGQRGISPGPHQPIIMQSSKFTFPPTSWSQGGPAQGDYLPGANRQPPPPYPLSRHSPTDQQQAPATASSPSYVNGGGQSQSMMGSNRNSHNLDMYNLGPPQLWSQAAAAPPQQQQPLADEPSVPWQHHPPVRSNSFSSHPLGGRPAGSQPSPTTVTAVTQAPVLQPVKSTRVQKPELHTAVAPAHPPWMQPPPSQQQQQAHLQPAPPYQEPPTASSSCSSASAPQIPEAPSYQGPPPPYPKHLLQQQPPTYEPTAGRQEANAEEEDGGREAAAEKEKGRKQITTSPVPVRRSKRDEERRGESGRVAAYSPQAFKFFMEQHVENVLKNHQQRILRRKQLECEMQRVRQTVTQKSLISSGFSTCCCFLKRCLSFSHLNLSFQPRSQSIDCFFDSSFSLFLLLLPMQLN